MFSVMRDHVCQEIDGFGVCLAFHQAGMLRKHPKCDEVMDLLFDTAGVSILRNIVGDGGVWGDETNGPTPTIEPEEGVWQFEGDEEQIWAAREALKRRCEKVMATVWSPPAWMKTNACVHDGGELRRDKYQAFAEYLSRYVREWRDRFGIELTAISPANEPDLVTKYSSCIWNGEQYRDFVRDYLAPVFKQDGVTAKVIMPETTSCVDHVQAYTDLIFADEAATNAVDIVGLHGYGHETVIAPVRGAAEHGKKIWQTELCDINVMEEWQRGNDIVNGIFWAENIHDYVNLMGVSAYIYFWGTSIYPNGGNLIGIDMKTGEITVPKRLYTFANFSRFVRPGYRRVTVYGTGAETKLSAFLSPDGHELVLVSINPLEREATLYAQIGETAEETVRTYRTSETENLAEIAPVKLEKGCIQETLPPQSVTTWLISL